MAPLLQVFLTFLSLPTYAYAENHVLRIFGLNSETFADCEASIDDIANRIALRHGVSISASFCETSTSTNRVTGLIGYVSEEPLVEVSTYTSGALYAPKGMFPTKQHCESSIQDEISIFQANTGLNMTYAFCAKEPLSSGNSWYPHIAAFGIAEKIPYRSSWHSDVPYGKDMVAIRNSLSQHFSDRSAEFINVNYKDTGASGLLTAFYYVRSDHAPLQIYDSVVATIPGLAACMSTAARIKQNNVLIGENPVIDSYCTSAYSNPTRFELILLHEGMAFLDSFQHSREFASLELCENSRSAIEEELRIIHGNKLVTTVCGHPKFTLSSLAPYFVIGAKQY